jgi:hypothetical protein
MNVEIKMPRLDHSIIMLCFQNVCILHDKY